MAYFILTKVIKKSVRSGAPILLAHRRFSNFCPNLDFKNVSNRPHAINVKDAVDLLVNNKFDDHLLPREWPRRENRFLTKSKRHIVAHVQFHVDLLEKNVFFDHTKNSMHLIYGEKGIGKSTALRLAVMGIWISNPKVIPIYIEYDGPVYNFVAPTEILSKALHLPEDTTISECLNELKKQDKFAFIVIDHIEKVYNGTDNPNRRKFILDNLGDLISSQTNGRVFAYLCSSSYLTPALLSKQAIQCSDIIRQFPFIQQAPSFNIYEYDYYYYCLSIKEDIKTVQQIYNLSSECLNLLYYLFGGSLRDIDDNIHLIQNTTVKDKYIIQSLQQQCYAFNSYDPRLYPLIDALYDKLIEINYKDIYDVATIGMKAVSQIDWITAIKPLTREHIDDICTHLKIQHYEHLIHLLIDYKYFTGSPDLSSLFPKKPSDLLAHFPQYIHYKTAMKISQNIPLIGNYLRKSLYHRVVQGLTEDVIKETIHMIRS